MPIPSFSHHILQPVVRKGSQRLLQSAPRLVSLFSLVSADADTLLPSSNAAPTSARDFLKQRCLSELTQAFADNAGPSRVWGSYMSVMHAMGHDKLPLELHQEVLRRCTPPSAELRVTSARRLAEGIKTASPHIHETRFQTIIRNIRADDALPTLEDYHFILEQFAAVGHHVGAMHVYKELTHVGRQPRTKTFGLCLQAIAHRLTLPTSESSKPRRVSQTRLMLRDLMADMQRLGMPFTSVNLDLTIRILKETSDLENFEKLMRWGYGIDLSNPDRPPIEYLGTGTLKSDLGLAQPEASMLPRPQPFSTAALNTTLDFLGRINNVSKLVQAFEVLTRPLPHANQHPVSSFDDEDDFGVAGSDPAPSFVLPHAQPNITSYNILIRHLCRIGHSTLARHYLNELRHLDRAKDDELRAACRETPPERIPSPRISINRASLLPVFGWGNHDGDVALMRWFLGKIPKIIKRKRSNLGHYKYIKMVFWTQGRPGVDPAVSVDSLGCSTNPDPPSFSPASSLASSSANGALPKSQLQRNSKTTSVFDVDLEAPPPVEPTPNKIFDIDLHISLLQRDLEDIEAFYVRAQDIYARQVQRQKECLGRRVWDGKDIYLATEERRVLVDRDRWRDIVRFRPRLGLEGSPPSSPRQVPPHLLPDNRSFSTYFSSNGLIASGAADNRSSSS